MMVNWYMVECDAFTAIRKDMSVHTLIWMSAQGNDTPVSGDALTRSRNEFTRALRSS